MDNGDQSILRVVDTLLYDRRVCYEHTWEAGDVVFSDPASTVYTHQGTPVECVNVD